MYPASILSRVTVPVVESPAYPASRRIQSEVTHRDLRIDVQVVARLRQRLPLLEIEVQRPGIQVLREALGEFEIDVEPGKILFEREQIAQHVNGILVIPGTEDGRSAGHGDLDVPVGRAGQSGVIETDEI